MSLKRYFPEELFRVLMALDEHKNRDITIMELPGLANVSKAFTIGILRDLADDGFVTVKPSVKDRRQRFVRLEEAGKILLEHLLAYKQLLEGRMDVYQKTVKARGGRAWAR
jgi:DNA-binding MarR family transcriptional regulator